MPEGDVRIFGADTHVSKKSFPWVLGGAAIVTVLALRSRAAPSSGPSVDSSLADAAAANQAANIEFARLQIQSQSELAQLMAANKLEAQAQENAFQIMKASTPGAQRSCISLQQWSFLDAATKKSFQNRVANGQLIESLGPDGVCFTPTAAGAMGHMPYTTTKSKQGLFGGSTSVTGPANPTSGSSPQMAPQPGIFGFLESIIRAFNQPIF